MRSLRRRPSLLPAAEHPSSVGCAATTATRTPRLQFEPGLAPSQQVFPAPDESLACGPATLPGKPAVRRPPLALTLKQPGLRTEASKCLASAQEAPAPHPQ